MKDFSLVTTVFNEAKRLEQTIADIEAQLLLPNEIVITDAGSTDGTWGILEHWQSNSTISIVLLKEKGCNVARGRNLAIAKARHDLIASTDFGCRYTPQWLASIITPFENKEIEVVGGAFGIRINEIESQAAKADFVLQNGYPIVLDEYFSTSSRSIAYYKYVWERIGGYEEWLTLAADDTIFWRLIKRNNFTFELVDQPHVSWMRHSTYKAFAREAYRYGLGDGESGINLNNMVSHFVETWLRFCFVFLLLATPFLFYSGLTFWLLLLLPCSFGLRSYRNATRNWLGLSEGFSIKILISAFYLVELSRRDYLTGYFKGYFLSKKPTKDARKELTIRLCK